MTWGKRKEPISLILDDKLSCKTVFKKSNCMIKRNLTVPLYRAVQLPKPVLLEGPRGAGKTTLLQSEFPRRLYITLDDASDRRAARRDPAAFLARLRVAAVIDDVHRAPELTAYLARAPEPRPIILVSSRKLSLPITTLRLYHPTRAEREGRPPLALEMLGHFVPGRADHSRAVATWPKDHRLIERDIQELVKVQDLDRFHTFLQLALERSGQVLDQQKLAEAAGTSRSTVSRWLAVLDACFLTLRLQPCDYDFGRRLVQRPKLHLLESKAFESSVVSEIYRNAVHTAIMPDLRYWRDSNGLELAVVLQLPGSPPMGVAIVEVPNPTDEARLQRWMNLAGSRSAAMVSFRCREQQRRRIFRYTFDQL